MTACKHCGGKGYTTETTVHGVVETNCALCSPSPHSRKRNAWTEWAEQQMGKEIKSRPAGTVLPTQDYPEG